MDNDRKISAKAAVSRVRIPVKIKESRTQPCPPEDTVYIQPELTQPDIALAQDELLEDSADIVSAEAENAQPEPECEAEQPEEYIAEAAEIQTEPEAAIDEHTAPEQIFSPIPAKKYTAHIAFICDTAYVVPTCTAICSLVRSASADSLYDIIVVTAELSDDARETISQCAGDRADIRVVTGDMSKFAHLHIDTENSVRVASPAALLKFDLPYMLPELDKVLYLDSDIIVRGDLSKLFATDLASGGYLIAAAADSGQIYFKHEYVDRVDKYFNSGVMLMNLELMREENTPAALLEEKRANPQSNLMDQNVFNVVMNGRVRYLPPIYNFLYMSLCNACQYYSMKQLNALFGTDYASIGDIEREAVIIHYSSKNKPWKTECTALSDEWLAAFLRTPCHTAKLERYKAQRRPRFSVIVYMHNCGPYITRCVQSLKVQTLADFEVLLVENESTDNTLGLAKQLAQGDERFRWLRLPGASYDALNCALRLASGYYVLFIDGNETLFEKALEHMAAVIWKKNAEIVSFGTEISLSDRDGTVCRYSGAEPDCKLTDPMAVCLDCEQGGWPRVYSRSWLWDNRLYFANTAFRGEEFALRAAKLADSAVRIEETYITRIFDSMKKRTECPASYADAAVYLDMLEKLAKSDAYGHFAAKRLNETLDIFCAARPMLKEQTQPFDNYGAAEKVLLRCGQLEQQYRECEQRYRDCAERQHEAEEKYAEVIGSTAYKAGMMATALPRYIKRRLAKLRG